MPPAAALHPGANAIAAFYYIMENFQGERLVASLGRAGGYGQGPALGRLITGMSATLSASRLGDSRYGGIVLPNTSPPWKQAAG